MEFQSHIFVLLQANFLNLVSVYLQLGGMWTWRWTSKKVLNLSLRDSKSV